jgi:hypothetical protein
MEDPQMQSRLAALVPLGALAVRNHKLHCISTLQSIGWLR